MTHDEIVRWFRRFRYDPEFRGPNGSVPITCLAEFAGLSRIRVYQILLRDRRLTPYYEQRMRAAIEAVQAGLRWRRRGRRWEINDPKFERLPRYENRKAGVAA